MKTKKFLSFALVLAMLAGMLPGMSLTASAEGNTAPTTITSPATTGTMTITLVIAVASVKTAPEANTLTYSGSAQTLTTTGEAGVGTLQYQLGESATTEPTGTWGTTVPQGTEAKDYYVWYRSRVNDNNISTAGCKTVTIAKASITNATVTLSDTSLAYTGSEQSVTVSSVKLGDTTLTANTDYEVTSGTTGTAKNTYTVTVTGKGNYKDTATAQWSIGLATPTIETIPTASAITYGQKLADSTLTGGVAKLGDTTVAGTFAWKNTETKPAVSDSNATEYDVVFTPTDADNYAAVECKVKLTVNKADPTVTAPTAKTLTYNGSAQELVNAGSTEDGTLYYAVTTENTAPTDESLYTTSIPTKTEAGTYYVWYKVVGDTNHNDTDPAYVTVTISSRSTSSSSSSSNSGSSTPSGTTTTTTTTDTTSNPDASTTNGTATVTTTTNRDGSTTEKTTETATKSGGDGSKTEVKAESTTTTKSNRDGTTTAATTAATTATTTAVDGSKTVTETRTEAKETLNKSGNGTVEAKTTETVKDESGRVTATTVTESKGTVETATDGTKTTTTTNTAVTTDAAGNKTTVVTTEKATVTADGNTGKVVSDESGKVVSVEAKVSETAAESAAKSGETVTLPVTVTAAQSAADATAVAITVPKAAESVKVEIPVEDVKPGTVAVIVHEDGSEEIVRTSTTGTDGVVLTLDGGASIKIVDNTKDFVDVSGGEWYADNVAWASSREVMNGVGNNAFAPNEVTTTGMVAQILMNLSGETANPNTAAEKYSDIKANDWFAAPISWLTEAGIAQGEGDAFGATEAITRERDIVLLHNYARHMGYDTSARADLNRFADAGSVSDWARDAMAWAVGAGIINGTTDGNRNVVLDPQGSATRAQVTAMTERFCKKTAK